MDIRQSRKILAAILGAVLAIGFAGTPAFAELPAVRAAIQAKQAKWKAGPTSVSGLSDEEKALRAGLIKPVASTIDKIIKSDEPLPGSPPALDWRNFNGRNYVTPVRNQGSCGSCWAFATTGALESNVLIRNNWSGVDVNLSEQTLVSCGNAGSCSGGYISTASSYLRNTGIPNESCYTYTASNGTCGNTCSDWQASSHRIDSWSWVTTSSPTVTRIKNALNVYGPLVTTMDVYSDFYYYQSGIYSHTSGCYRGGHAVLIVGYDDNEQSFIVKNSWGSGWGEGGYFRIAYSELESVVEFGFYTISYQIAGGGCFYNVSPGSESYTSYTGAGNISVASQALCDWNAASNDSWITLSSGPSGAGTGTVAYTLAPNTGLPRTGTISVAGQTFLVTQGGPGATSDFNGDSRPDIVWFNQASGDVALWQMSGLAVGSLASLGSVGGAQWRIAGTADFHGDGKPDILWRNTTTGQIALWYMNGPLFLSPAGVGTLGDLNWQIAGVADFNADGKPDILWRNTSTGLIALWIMAGSQIADVQAIATVSDPNWQITGIGDFSQDGKPDILWRNSQTGHVALWVMDGPVILSSSGIGGVSDLNWQVAGAADFNADGKPDILWRHRVSGMIAVWIMNGSQFQSAAGLGTVADTNWQIVSPK